MKCLYANAISSVSRFYGIVSHPALLERLTVLDVLPATKTTLESKLKGGAIRRAKPLSGFSDLSTHISRRTHQTFEVMRPLFPLRKGNAQ